MRRSSTTESGVEGALPSTGADGRPACARNAVQIRHVVHALTWPSTSGPLSGTDGPPLGRDAEELEWARGRGHVDDPLTVWREPEALDVRALHEGLIQSQRWRVGPNDEELEDLVLLLVRDADDALAPGVHLEGPDVAPDRSRQGCVELDRLGRGAERAEHQGSESSRQPAAA